MLVQHYNATVLNWGSFSPPGDMRQCLETLFIVMTWWLPWAERVEARNAAKYPTVHRTAPTTKNYLVQKMPTVPKLRSSVTEQNG